ncbi:MAG: hypothetical protein PHH04_00025 [Thomasclavelia sp.]|nr:hypothetical protein [Thomasclavelia sp.]
MAQEVLSVKLNELDQQLSDIHSIISQSDKLNSIDIKDLIKEYENECNEDELSFLFKLNSSKAKAITKLSTSFNDIKDSLSVFRTTLEEIEMDKDEEVDEKLLMAEYELDYAIMVSKRSLLNSLKAIELQKENEGDN